MKSGNEAFAYFGYERDLDKPYGKWAGTLSGMEEETLQQYTGITYEDINEDGKIEGSYEHE